MSVGLVKVTAAAMRLITAIADIEDERRRDGARFRAVRGVRGRELATRLWPDAPGWKTHSNSGGIGSGMPRTAGCHAGKLSRLEEPLTRNLGWEKGWSLTRYGREQVIENRRATS